MIEPPFQHGIADMAFWFIQWYLPSAQPPQPKGAGAVFPYVLPRCSYFFKSFVTEMSIFICMHKRGVCGAVHAILWLRQKGHVLVPSFGFQIIFAKNFFHMFFFSFLKFI